MFVRTLFIGTGVIRLVGGRASMLLLVWWRGRSVRWGGILTI